MPKGLGLWGAGGGGQVMWHIKLKGMNGGPGYTDKFYPTIKLVTLGWGQSVNYQ